MGRVARYCFSLGSVTQVRGTLTLDFWVARGALWEETLSRETESGFACDHEAAMPWDYIQRVKRKSGGGVLLNTCLRRGRGVAERSPDMRSHNLE